MRFAEVVETSRTIAATSSRTAKRARLSALLARLQPAEIEPVVGFLVGEARQGRIGVGWRTFAAASPAGRAPAVAALGVEDVDRLMEALAGLSGSGSGRRRAALLGELLARATPHEAEFLAKLFGGELRQGALEGVMVDAVADAAELPVASVRRAVMFGGRLDHIARLALTGGREAVDAVGLELGRPLRPMLASTAASVEEALTTIGESSVEWKLDGIRIQVHRTGDRVRVWTRNLNEITERVPAVVRAVQALPSERLVLDGEAIGLDVTGRPRLFQDTASWRGRGSDLPEATTSGSPGEARDDGDLRPFFFDVLHLDGVDLVDAPLAERLDALDTAVGALRMPGAVTDDPAVGDAVLAEALSAGHEGVVVKAAGSPYEAGRRGRGWRKVKPVHTLDLVVLAVEWGHGRRQGWLSNLHLGARSDDGPGFVMVGKTFKGLTDELLRWQTERFLSLAEPGAEPTGTTGVVRVRPEQVVEVAVDGVQRSSRYAGGVALRFARVLRYREDKDPGDADVLSSVRSLLPVAGSVTDAVPEAGGGGTDRVESD